MEKVAVTGGIGFIGSHLSEELLRQGYWVKILDNIHTGNVGNIRHFDSTIYFSFTTGSIEDFDLLKHHFRDVSLVFHQAAIPSVPRSIKKPARTHEVNATGTLNVLMAARECGVKKVIYASSSSVYGETPTLPKTENMAPDPLSPYAVSKLTGEYYCRVFNHVYGLPTACLRYFNVYGPHQSAANQYAAVVPRFIKAVKEGKRPVIYGDGTQTRDFTYVKDVVRANIRAAHSDATGVFNICSGIETSINQLAETVTRLLGREDISPEYTEARSGDISRSQGDYSRARDAFEWEPAFSLEEGIRATLEYKPVLI